MPVTLEQVEELVHALPEVTVGQRFSNRTWYVGKKAFVWDRPLSGADIKRWDETTDGPLPRDPIIAVQVEDLAEKEAVLQQGRKGFFTMQHFDGYPALLIELRKATKRDVKDAIEDAWLARAPRKLADAYLSR